MRRRGQALALVREPVRRTLEGSLLVDLEAASGFGFPRLAALFGRGWS